VIKIAHLNISEKTTFTNEIGRAEIKLEFYKVNNGKLGKIYETEAFVEESGMDVTRGHEKRIRSVLKTCINSFNNSNWKSKKPEFEEMESVIADKTDVTDTSFSGEKQSSQKCCVNSLSLTGVSQFLCKWDRGIFFLLFPSCVNTSRELCLTV